MALKGSRAVLSVTFDLKAAERSSAPPALRCCCCCCPQVDVFAVYAITLVGGRHVLLPTFSAHDALFTMGEKAW